MEFLQRTAKSVIIASIMFFSLRYIGFSVSASLAFSLVPLVLGTINVMTGFAYSLAAIVLVLACTTALFPDWRDKGDRLIQSAFHLVTDAPREKSSK